jgi:hypothetical protein
MFETWDSILQERVSDGQIANAIFDAIGVRMRAMPFTPDNLLKTIEADQTSAQS